MNQKHTLGVEEQAQRRKKNKRSRRRANKDQDDDDNKAAPPPSPGRRKLFQSKVIQIQQRKIGLIIGPRGKNIKELYKLTHCDILLPKARRKKDVVAQPEAEPLDEYEQWLRYGEVIYNAHDEEQRPPQKAQPKGSKPDGDHKDDDEMDEDDPRRLVDITLRGSPEEIRDAEVEIAFMAQHGRLMFDHERAGDKKKKKRTKKASRRSARGADGVEVELDDTEIAEDIRVPSKICGMLIGGGGQRVKELMDETGAEIWVDWDKESHIEAGVSTVHLKGTRYDVEFAKQEIRRIQSLFERGSTNYRFEIPAYCSRELFAEKGSLLKQLQKDYNVSITVKNYRNEKSYMRIGDDEQQLQSTLMLILIGEAEDQMACKKGIDKLLGVFLKCMECDYLQREDDGYADNMSGAWFCNRCWDDFNGVDREQGGRRRDSRLERGGDGGRENIDALSNRMGNMNLNENHSPRQHYPQTPYQGGAPPQHQHRPNRGDPQYGGYSEHRGGANNPRYTEYGGQQRPQQQQRQRQGPPQRLVGNVGKNGKSRNKW